MYRVHNNLHCVHNSMYRVDNKLNRDKCMYEIEISIIFWLEIDYYQLWVLCKIELRI